MELSQDRLQPIEWAGTRRFLSTDWTLGPVEYTGRMSWDPQNPSTDSRRIRRENALGPVEFLDRFTTNIELGPVEFLDRSTTNTRGE